jgi:hypothetical protein
MNKQDAMAIHEGLNTQGTHTITRWRVICPTCSQWFVADQSSLSAQMFEAHRQLKHFTLATSVKPVQFQAKY